MEEKQNFPRATGFSGKILIASLFILSGILLFARNMGWITSEVFDIIVSWHSLLILLGLNRVSQPHIPFDNTALCNRVCWLFLLH